jgi:cytochrome c peroxidase
VKELAMGAPTSMRRVVPVVLIVVASFGALAVWKGLLARSGPTDVSALLQLSYIRRVDSLDLALRALAVLPPHSDARTAQAAFRRARAAYKRIEYLVEFDDAFVEGPYWAIALNGPPVPTVNEDDRETLLVPTGLQVIEAALFPQPTPNFPEVVQHQVEHMRQVLQRIRIQPAETLEADRRALDAARLEVARIATLGVAGFDATLSGDGLRESAEALRGVGDGLMIYEQAMQERDSDGWNALNRSIEAATAYLETSTDYDGFDRLAFLTRFVNPITEGLDRLQQALKLPPSRYPSAWSSGATNIYAAGALDPRWFAPDYAPPARPALIALGQQLFFDPVLSLHGRRSCATCHQPSRSFSDGLIRASVDPGRGFVRNTPTLLNAGLQAFQFADQRARFLEFQIEDVMQNPREMGLPVDAAARKLGADSVLVARFAAALGKPGRQALTGQTLAVALAAYVRSLGAMNSRFDRAVRGDPTALTASERRGFNLFMGKARCGTCHFPPLFGGTMPPSYREAEPEVIGVPARPLSQKATLDPDPGVFAIDHVPLHRHAFKTPNLRNVAVTAPYMHNGVFRTLDEVIEFYDLGGGNGLGMKLPNQTLSPDSLHLSDQEKDDLVAFHGALTDTASVTPTASPGPS